MKGNNMLTEKTSNKQIKIEDPVVEAIERYKMSSISIIASHIEKDEEVVLETIKDYISSGVLTGKLSEDETRFFKSDVKVSDAPVVRSNKESVELVQPDTSVGKYLMLTGIISIISGLVLRSLTGITLALTNMGTSLTLVGFIILASGWLFISRKEATFKPIES
jgi:hypothetical protein